MDMDRQRRDPWPRSAASAGVWWRTHVQLARETTQYASVRLGSTLAIWLLMGIALGLPAALAQSWLLLAELAGDWEGRPGIHVYFAPGAPESGALSQRLAGRPGISLVQTTSQSQALEDYVAKAGVADVLIGLETNPLPASFRVLFEEGMPAASVAATAEALRGEPGVAEVVVEGAWVQRVDAAIRLVQWTGIILGVALAVGAVLTVTAVIRLAIQERLDELRVMKLVGASDAQIRRPFLYFGTFYGAGGGLIAAMLTSIALTLLEGPARALLGNFGHTVNLAAMLTGPFVLGLIGTGALIGIVGALLAARNRLARLDIL